MRVSLSALKLDPVLPASAFAFNPPPGATESKGMDADLIRVGAAAPAFDVQTQSGARVSLASALKGHKALVLNFWFYG